MMSAQFKTLHSRNSFNHHRIALLNNGLIIFVIHVNALLIPIPTDLLGDMNGYELGLWLQWTLDASSQPAYNLIMLSRWIPLQPFYGMNLHEWWNCSLWEWWGLNWLKCFAVNFYVGTDCLSNLISCGGGSSILSKCFYLLKILHVACWSLQGLQELAECFMQ